MSDLLALLSCCATPYMSCTATCCVDGGIGTAAKDWLLLACNQVEEDWLACFKHGGGMIVSGDNPKP